MVDSKWNRLNLLMENGQMTDRERVAIMLNAGLDMLDQQYGMITVRQGDRLAIQYATEKSWMGVDFAISQSLDQFILRDMQTFGLDDTCSVPWEQYGIIEELRFGAFIGAPITIHKTLYGTLSFASDHAHQRLFSDQEFAYLKMMASAMRSLLVVSHEF